MESPEGDTSEFDDQQDAAAAQPNIPMGQQAQFYQPQSVDVLALEVDVTTYQESRPPQAQQQHPAGYPPSQANQAYVTHPGYPQPFPAQPTQANQAYGTHPSYPQPFPAQPTHSSGLNPYPLQSAQVHLVQQHPGTYPPIMTNQASYFPPNIAQPSSHQAAYGAQPGGQYTQHCPPNVAKPTSHQAAYGAQPAAPYTQPNIGTQGASVGGHIPPSAQNPQVIGVVGGISVQAQRTDGWRTGLFDCMDDPRNALITAVLPCLTYGEIAEILDEGHTSCQTSALIYGLVTFILMPGMVSYMYRTKLRNKFALVGSPASDWATHLLCEPCALCQEYRELKLRGLDPAIGWQGNLSRNQSTMQHHQQAAMTPPMNQRMTG